MSFPDTYFDPPTSMPTTMQTTVPTTMPTTIPAMTPTITPTMTPTTATMPQHSRTLNMRLGREIPNDGPEDYERYSDPSLFPENFSGAPSNTI